MKRSKKETRGGAAKQTLAVEMRGDAWEIVHPRCARRRREDIEEIADMLASGEIDIAKDELVWLLSECPDFLEAHVQLCAIAMESDDLRLARGHFGRAYELSLRALEAAGNPRPLPYALRGNESSWNCPDCWHAEKDLSDRAMSDTLEEIACRLDTVKSFPEIYEWRLLYDDHELFALSNA